MDMKKLARVLQLALIGAAVLLAGAIWALLQSLKE